MPKTLVLLLATLTVSVLGIGVAYLVGLQTAEYRMQSEIERSQKEQRALIDELRRDLAPRPVDVAVAAPVEIPPSPAEPEAAPEPATAAVEPMASTPEPVAETSEPVEPEPASTEMAKAIDEEKSAVASWVESPDMPDEVMPERETPLPAEPAAPPIAREAFDKVALGARYADVAECFGRDGLAALTMEDADGTETKQYVWDWTGPDGAACRVSMRFVDGVLTDKVYRE